jgi:hypothetical protein
MRHALSFFFFALHDTNWICTCGVLLFVLYLAIAMDVKEGFFLFLYSIACLCTHISGHNRCRRGHMTNFL